MNIALTAINVLFGIVFFFFKYWMGKVDERVGMLEKRQLEYEHDMVYKIDEMKSLISDLSIVMERGFSGLREEMRKGYVTKEFCGMVHEKGLA